MNCKPGDLAIFVGHGPRAGKIFRVIRAVTNPPIVKFSDGKKYKLTSHPMWEVDPPSFARFQQLGIDSQAPIPYVSDKLLRPLIDNNREDETLAWAGKPIRHVVNEAFDEARKGAA